MMFAAYNFVTQTNGEVQFELQEFGVTCTTIFVGAVVAGAVLFLVPVVVGWIYDLLHRN